MAGSRGRRHRRGGAVQDDRFDGRITGVGTTSGVRVVIGDWSTSPLGTFVDVMVEEPGGHRVLFAPSDAVADYVSETYTFDEIVVTDLHVQRRDAVCRVACDGLDVHVETGRRAALGWLLRLVPAPLATHPRWVGLLDPVARRVMRGVRTRGTARAGRQEFYGATDVHDVRRVWGRYRGADLGSLADVWPPVRFGFGSAPRRPSSTRVVTTVRRHTGVPDRVEPQV